MPEFMSGLLFFGVLLLLFLVFREIVCWYWKLNAVVELLQSILDRLPPLTPPVPSENEEE